MPKENESNTPPKEPKKPSYWDKDALECMADIVLGNVFKLPEVKTETVVPKGTKNGEGEGRSNDPGNYSININLGSLFKRSKQRDDDGSSTVTSKEKSSTVGKQNEDAGQGSK